MIWCNATGDSTLQPVTICMNVQGDIRRGTSIYEHEIHERSDVIFKEAIGIE